MDTGHLDRHGAIDEHPNVVVAGELELLGALVLEPVAQLGGEGEIVIRPAVAKS